MVMKKILQSIYLSLLAISMISFIGCTEEDWSGTENVVEGQPITVSMKLGSSQVGNIVVNTRGNDEFSDLNNLIIFIYNANGVCERVVSTIDGTLQLGTSGSVSSGRTQVVTFETTSGRKKLLAVANGKDNGFWEDVNVETLKQMTFNNLKAYVISLGQSVIGEERIQPFQITASSQMLISGWNDNLVFGVDGIISNYGDEGDSNTGVAIKMTRLMAHITFNIDEKLDGAKGTFVPTSYRVYNVPRKSILTNKDKNITTLEDVDFIDYSQEVIQGADNGVYTFSFYMPENICNEMTDVTDYNDREKWTGAGDTSENKEWNVAPQTSTFVVISGTYTETGTNNYTGNVEYTIHLGDFSSTGSLGNFSVERNCSYTYKMSVKGVDMIVVEAKKESGEYQNGAEGDIYDSGSSKYNYLLDAHYEQVLLEYDLTSIAESLGNGLSGDELDNAIADKLILVIQSEAMDYSADEPDYSVSNKRGRLKPYKIYADAIRDNTSVDEAKTRVLQGAGTGNQPTKGFDYKWVEFWPQSSSTELAEYPGVSSWSRDDVTGMKNTSYYGGTATTDSEKLMDVYDVIVAMGKVIKQIYNGEQITTGTYNEDGIVVSRVFSSSSYSYKARFTAFVNEYFYLRHPLTGEKVETWSVFTNKIPREMIIAMSTDTSTDGNSTYSYIYSNISQLSMQTFYNSRVKSLNGFGIETYNETPIDYEFGKTGTSGTLSDGHQNQLDLIKDYSYDTPQWAKYINYSSNGWTTSIGDDRASHKLRDAAYVVQKAYSACMSRNRDLNGNGRIDNNEVRWYLASLNEYIRMGIGANAISSAAQLYMGSKSAMVKSSYPSSYISQGSLYYTSSSDGERAYWAVEKGSYGTDQSFFSGTLPIRCIRILPGTDSGQHDISTVEGVQSDATYELYSGGKGQLSVLKFKGRLVESLYRERVATSLNIHNEDQPANSFYDGIIVASKNIGATYSEPEGNAYKLGDIIGYNGTVSWYNNGQQSYTNDGSKTDPCRLYYSEGRYGIGQWRVPNLVELSAMNAAGLLDSGQETACCTQFSNQKVRYGFAYSSLIYCPGAEVYQIANDCHIRCVRDVDVDYFSD